MRPRKRSADSHEKAEEGRGYAILSPPPFGEKGCTAASGTARTASAEHLFHARFELLIHGVVL